MTSSNSAAGVPGFIKEIFVLGTDLLGFLPAWLGQLIVAVALVIITALLVNWSVRSALPWLGGRLGRLGAWIVRMVGYVLLLLEFIPTRLLRAVRVRPPKPLYAYGTVVARGVDGTERAVAAGLGAAEHLRRTPRIVLIAALLVVLATWNQTSCGSGDVTCKRPVDTWRTTTADWFRAAKQKAGEPCAATGNASCKPSPSPSARKKTR